MWGAQNIGRSIVQPTRHGLANHFLGNFAEMESLNSEGYG